MKKFLFLLIVPIMFIGCESGTSSLGKVLEGEHFVNVLRLSNDSTLTPQNRYFLLKENGTKLTFSWTLPDSTTIVSTIPMDKVRMKFDTYTEVTTIKFRWRPKGEAGSNWDEIFKDYVSYMVVSCKESDFPLYIPAN